VLINLLDNAVAAVEGGGDIRIETSYDQELRMATLTVADTGHGIAPEDKPRLFEPYFSTKKSGTGLGLAIVTTIVSDHGGFIRVKDNEPQGTVFIIEFPASGEYV
jgi:two-component system nitrogen regulation sensor histidine kinase NtrY